MGSRSHSNLFDKKGVGVGLGNGGMAYAEAAAKKKRGVGGAFLEKGGSDSVRLCIYFLFVCALSST